MKLELIEKEHGAEILKKDE